MKSRTPFLASVTSLTGLVAATASAYFFRWWGALYSAIPFLAGLLGALLALIVLVKALTARIKRKPGLTTIERYLLLVGLFLLSQFAYFPIASTIFDWEIERAQSFAEALIPALETYKNQHGAYPDDLSLLLPPDTSAPSLLRLSATQPFEFDNRAFYRQRGTTYGFQFYVPDGFIGYSYEYCCGAHGKWTVTD
ncbi:MAG: hypothetical protein ACOYYU_13440 [Chloroflexota bacterium]